MNRDIIFNNANRNGYRIDLGREPEPMLLSHSGTIGRSVYEVWEVIYAGHTYYTYDGDQLFYKDGTQFR